MFENYLCYQLRRFVIILCCFGGIYDPLTANLGLKRLNCIVNWPKGQINKIISVILVSLSLSHAHTLESNSHFLSTHIQLHIRKMFQLKAMHLLHVTPCFTV